MIGNSGLAGMQEDFLSALETKLKADTRICAAWLEGSFGRGEPDRYSDIDLHLLVDKAAVESFRARGAGMAFCYPAVGAL